MRAINKSHLPSRPTGPRWSSRPTGPQWFGLALGAAVLLSLPTFAAPPADDSAPADPGTRSAVELRRELETSMSTLGELANDARGDSDAQRATCVLDKHDRAAGVMELATGDLIVANDSAADDAERGFALQKVEASLGRMEQLVEQAYQCRGDASPNVIDDQTENEADETQSIPIADPTDVAGRSPPVPPPVDDSRPPTVGSPSR